jgi:hypothetical protein
MCAVTRHPGIPQHFPVRCSRHASGFPSPLWPPCIQLLQPTVAAFASSPSQSIVASHIQLFQSAVAGAWPKPMRHLPCQAPIISGIPRKTLSLAALQIEYGCYTRLGVLESRPSKSTTDGIRLIYWNGRVWPAQSVCRSFSSNPSKVTKSHVGAPGHRSASAADRRCSNSGYTVCVSRCSGARHPWPDIRHGCRGRHAATHLLLLTGRNPGTRWDPKKVEQGTRKRKL